MCRSMANPKTKHRNDVKVVFEVLARNSLVMDGGVRDIKTSGFCCERTIGSDSALVHLEEKQCQTCPTLTMRFLMKIGLKLSD